MASKLRQPTKTKNNQVECTTVVRAGRTYYTSLYPLPVDLAETHRHTLLTLLTLQIYKTPILSSELLENPPLRVLEIGCDTGFWSQKCHQYFKDRGHRASFVGIDLKPSAHVDSRAYRRMGMDWQYFQHDLRKAPWPLETHSYDLIMTRNSSLIFPGSDFETCMSEYVRLLKPGGTLEIWELDFALRTLKPQIMQMDDDHPELASLGIYSNKKNSTMGPAVNPYVSEYNGWLATVLGSRGLTHVPCTQCALGAIGMLADAERLQMTDSKRLAVPLGEIMWEHHSGRARALTEEQKAIRASALNAFLLLFESFEPLLKTTSGKGEADWDDWMERAKSDWTRVGLQFGECLEFGAWTMRKEEEDQQDQSRHDPSLA